MIPDFDNGQIVQFTASEATQTEDPVKSTFGDPENDQLVDLSTPFRLEKL